MMKVDIVLGEKFSHIWSVDKLYTRISDLCELRGIDVQFIHFPPAPHWMNWFKYDLNWSAAAVRRLAMCHYIARTRCRKDAITHISHNYVAYTKTFGTHHPSVLHIQDMIMEQDYGGMGRRRLRYLTEGFSNIDAFVVSTDYVKAKVLDTFPDIPEEKITRIYPGIDYEVMKNADKTKSKERMESLYGVPADCDFVLCFGADQYRKNATAAIKAFESLAEDYPALHFVKAGTSHIKEERNYIDRYIARSKFKDRIHRFYEIPNSHVCTMYNAAACTVFPSLDEGYGMPPLESIACGTFPVVSNLTCLPEIMGEDYPFLVNPYDITDIAANIEDLITEDPAVIASSAIRYRAEQQKTHDITKSVSSLISLWETLPDPTSYPKR